MYVLLKDFMNFKKLIYVLAGILFFILSFFLVGRKGTAAEVLVTVDGNFQYEVFSEEVYITGYEGTEKKVVVPANIDGHPVHHLEGIFYGNDKIEEVVISEGIETLQYSFIFVYSSLIFPLFIGFVAFYGLVMYQNTYQFELKPLLMPMKSYQFLLISLLLLCEHIGSL